MAELLWINFAVLTFNVSGIVSSSQRHDKIVPLKAAFWRLRRRGTSANQRSANDCGILDHVPGANPHIVTEDSAADPRAALDNHVVPEYRMFDLSSP